VIDYTERIPQARIEMLVRIYHTAEYASDATGLSRAGIKRAAKRYGLQFRRNSNGYYNIKKEEDDGEQRHIDAHPENEQQKNTVSLAALQDAWAI